MNRRSFLVSLLAVPAAVVAPRPPTLFFHPDAFRIAMAPITQLKYLQRKYNDCVSQQVEQLDGWATNRCPLKRGDVIEMRDGAWVSNG